MTWLIAFICAHAIEIAAVGGVFATVSSIETVVINTHTIIDMHKDEEKK